MPLSNTLSSVCPSVCLCLGFYLSDSRPCLSLRLSRCNHLDGDSKEVSPVMDQFLECVWQLTEQFPCAFEFNERFLIAVHHHMYACQYGNFVGNNQRERQQLG